MRFGNSYCWENIGAWDLIFGSSNYEFCFEFMENVGQMYSNFAAQAIMVCTQLMRHVFVPEALPLDCSYRLTRRNNTWEVLSGGFEQDVHFVDV